MIDIDAYKQLIGSLTKLVMDATEADAKDMFEETVGNAVALYNQIKSDQTMLGEVMRTLLDDRTEELHWESMKRNLAEERLHRVMEMDNATK